MNNRKRGCGSVKVRTRKREGDGVGGRGVGTWRWHQRWTGVVRVGEGDQVQCVVDLCRKLVWVHWCSKGMSCEKLLKGNDHDHWVVVRYCDSRRRVTWRRTSVPQNLYKILLYRTVSSEGEVVVLIWPLGPERRRWPYIVGVVSSQADFFTVNECDRELQTCGWRVVRARLLGGEEDPSLPSSLRNVIVYALRMTRNNRTGVFCVKPETLEYEDKRLVTLHVKGGY